MRRTQAGARKHGDDRLGNHGKVNRNPVTLLDTQGSERIGGLADFFRELGVGVGAGVAGLAFEVDGDTVAVAGFHVTVKTVVCDVEGAVGEPLGKRRVGPVEDLGERRVPRHEFACVVLPELESVCL